MGLEIINGQEKLLGGLVGIGMVGVFLGWQALKYIRKMEMRAAFEKENGQKRQRSMSFNSSVMINGGFPPEAEVWPPIINCLFLFNECPSADALIESCKNLLFYERFRSAVKFDGENWNFVEVDIDYSNHVKTVGVISEADVMAEADRIAQNDLDGMDGSQPLWCLYRIVNKGAGVSAVLIRIHHVIGDGIALVSAMSKIISDAKGAPATIGLPSVKVTEEAAAMKKEKSGGGTPFTFKVLKSFFNIVSTPNTPFDTKLHFHPANRQKLFMTKRRRTILFPTLRLDFVKNLKNKAQATINDILLSAVVGAIRRYCEKRGDPAVKGSTADNKKFLSRCLMPIALPRSKYDLAHPAEALRNYWVFLSANLPFTALTAKERVTQCNATTTELKSSPTAGVQMWLQQVLPHVLPVPVQRKTAYDIFTRHTMVFSNVPGPASKVFMAGKEVVAIQTFFPNLIPQVIIISYAGGVYFNMSVDDEALPGAVQELPEHYLAEIREMARDFGVDASEKEMLCPTTPGGVFGLAQE